MIVCRADADLSLLGKGLPPPQAFEDKVVWITGASQVETESTLQLPSAATSYSLHTYNYTQPSLLLELVTASVLPSRSVACVYSLDLSCAYHW